MFDELYSSDAGEEVTAVVEPLRAGRGRRKRGRGGRGGPRACATPRAEDGQGPCIHPVVEAIDKGDEASEADTRASAVPRAAVAEDDVVGRADGKFHIAESKEPTHVADATDDYRACAEPRAVVTNTKEGVIVERIRMQPLRFGAGGGEVSLHEEMSRVYEEEDCHAQCPLGHPLAIACSTSAQVYRCDSCHGRVRGPYVTCRQGHFHACRTCAIRVARA